MTQKKIPKGFSVFFLSWFYSGLSPKAPGTVGSLATIPLILLLHHLDFNLYALLFLILILYLISIYLTQKIQTIHDLHDPQWIVIDEVIGMLITWSFVRRVDPASLFWVFSLFRIFDIIKVWPASYFDKMLHGFGTITDDVISALYAGITALFILSFF
jgi:phosphatidylglycerophosphatase A